MTSYRLQHHEIAPALVLAPMSGVTTSALRRLIKGLNPGCVGLVVSEFISVEGLTRQARRSVAMMRYHEEERPYAIQIFGHDITRMRDAAMMVQDAGADIVDINCGCPAPKVVRKGGGCELMRQPDHLRQIFREVRKAVKIPLTAKMRSGWDSNSINAPEIAKIMEGEGVEAIAVHGRTRAQLYRGEADWSWVRQVAELVKIPVLGSGDVVDRASAEARRTGKVAGLFIGRAAMSNPFVFTEIVHGSAPDLRTNPLLVLDIIDRYITLLREEFTDTAAVGKVKQLISQMCRSHPWRKDVLRAPSLTVQCELLRVIRDQVMERGASGIDAPARQESPADIAAC